MKIQSFIRWLLCVPSAVFMLILVYSFARILKPIISEHAILRTVFFQVTMGCLASFTSAFLFVASGALVAPFYQTHVAKIFAFVFVLLSVFKVHDIVSLDISGTFDTVSFYSLLAAFSGICGALVILFLFRSRNTEI